MTDGNDPMETLKKIFKALTGAHQSLDNLEKELQKELVVARSNTKEALEALRKMAQDMQWRVENLENQVEAQGKRHDAE